MQEHHSVRLNVVLASGAPFAGIAAGLVICRCSRHAIMVIMKGAPMKGILQFLITCLVVAFTLMVIVGKLTHSFDSM